MASAGPGRRSRGRRRDQNRRTSDSSEHRHVCRGARTGSQAGGPAPPRRGAPRPPAAGAAEDRGARPRGSRAAGGVPRRRLSTELCSRADSAATSSTSGAGTGEELDRVGRSRTSSAWGVALIGGHPVQLASLFPEQAQVDCFGVTGDFRAPSRAAATRNAMPVHRRVAHRGDLELPLRRAAQHPLHAGGAPAGVSGRRSGMWSSRATATRSWTTGTGCSACAAAARTRSASTASCPSTG